MIRNLKPSCTIAWHSVVFLPCVIARKKPVMKKFGNYIVILYSSSGSRRADIKWGFEEEVNFFDD